MARPSNRASVLDAAIRVAAREPITTVTVDAVATEAGLTKPGVLYHFPSKDELLIAVQGHLAAEWEEQLIAAAGGTADETSPTDRVAAYARVAAQSATRAELVLLLEASANPAVSAPMRTVIDRWAPPLEAALDDPSLWPLVLVRLAADGLWLCAANEELSPTARRRIAEAIAGTAVAGDATD